MWMKIGFVLFDRVTFLDFVGFYDVITRFRSFEKTSNFTWDICGLQSEVMDELGISIKVNKVKPDLAGYDMLFVPGGMGTRELRYNEVFIDWLRGAEHAEYLISVCTGSLLLGAAGFLKGKRATTNSSAYDLLAPYCHEVERVRITRDGNVITGGGVATSIDLGLYIARLFLDDTEVNQIKQQMDYPYTYKGIESL
jgi:transcriptional regulator GlxA family with amidase domain